MLGRLVRLIALLVLATYASRLAWGRGALFFREWRISRAQYFLALEQHNSCSSNHENQHIFKAACEEAVDIVEVWPIIQAVTKSLNQTYLCIEVPCGSLIIGIIDTWPGLILMCSLPVVLCALAICYIRAVRNETRPVSSPASGWVHYSQPNTQLLNAPKSFV